MWEVIGFEEQLNDAGEVTAYSVHAVKAFPDGKGHGKRCRRVWYRTSEVGYKPFVGDNVIIETEVRGKFEAVIDIFAV